MYNIGVLYLMYLNANIYIRLYAVVEKHCSQCVAHNIRSNSKMGLYFAPNMAWVCVKVNLTVFRSKYENASRTDTHTYVYEPERFTSDIHRPRWHVVFTRFCLLPIICYKNISTLMFPVGDKKLKLTNLSTQHRFYRQWE